MNIRSKMALILCLVTTLVEVGSAQPEVQVMGVNGYSADFFEAGDGTPIVGVHGAVSDYRVWLPYAEKFQDDYRFVGYTRRYYGNSDWPDENVQYSHDAHSADLAAFITQLEIGPVHLFARSSGAHTAVILASERPDLVKSLLFWEPVVGEEIVDGYTQDQEAANDWGSRWTDVLAAEKAGDLRQAARLMIETVYELPIGGFDRLPETSQATILDNARTLPILFDQTKIAKTDCDYVGNIDAPTLILQGSKTHKGLSREFARLHDCMPNSTVESISGVTHQGAVTHVATISEVVRSYLATFE